MKSTIRTRCMYEHGVTAATRLGLSRIDCSTYAQENHSRCNSSNYCFTQAKCGAMNHKLISTDNRRVKINNASGEFSRHFLSYRSILAVNFPFFVQSKERKERTFKTEFSAWEKVALSVEKKNFNGATVTRIARIGFARGQFTVDITVVFTRIPRV